MTCLTFETCNIDPAVGLVIVICLLTLAAVVFKGDLMGASFRGAVDALLKLLIRLLEKRTGADKDNDKTT